jgi:hypothetical protein
MTNTLLGASSVVVTRRPREHHRQSVSRSAPWSNTTITVRHVSGPHSELNNNVDFFQKTRRALTLPIDLVLECLTTSTPQLTDA